MSPVGWLLLWGWEVISTWLMRSLLHKPIACMTLILSHDAAEAVTIHRVPSQNTIRETSPSCAERPRVKP